MQIFLTGRHNLRECMNWICITQILCIKSYNGTKVSLCSSGYREGFNLGTLVGLQVVVVVSVLSKLSIHTQHYTSASIKKVFKLKLALQNKLLNAHNHQWQRVSATKFLYLYTQDNKNLQPVKTVVPYSSFLSTMLLLEMQYLIDLL